MQYTVFSAKNASIKRCDFPDTFSEYSIYKVACSGRQRKVVKEIARNGLLTARSLLPYFGDLKSPERSCREELTALCRYGVLRRLEIWHDNERTGVAYELSESFKAIVGDRMQVVRYAEQELTAKEMLEWMSLSSFACHARRVVYRTDKLFPFVRMTNRIGDPYIAAVSCRYGQELLPRLVMLTDQLAGRREWAGVVVFESFQAMQRAICTLHSQLDKTRLPMLYCTYDRCCIRQPTIYRTESIPGAGTKFTPVQISLLRGNEK